jgi:hypothetical protein
MWCKMKPLSTPQPPLLDPRAPPWRYLEQRVVAGIPFVCIGSAPALAGDPAPLLRLQDDALAIRRLGGNAWLAPARGGVRKLFAHPAASRRALQKMYDLLPPVIATGKATVWAKGGVRQ